MPSYSDAEDYYLYDSDYDSEDTWDSQEEYEDEEPTIEEGWEDPEDLIYKDPDQMPTESKVLTIGEQTIRVFNTGAVQYPNSIFHVTYGTPVIGTPYRSVPIKMGPNDHRNIYVHELVWRAFHGHVPNGWRVGHIDRYSDFDSSYCYNNHLTNLDIYLETVHYMNETEMV